MTSNAVDCLVAPVWLLYRLLRRYVTRHRVSHRATSDWLGTAWRTLGVAEDYTYRTNGAADARRNIAHARQVLWLMIERTLLEDD